MEDFYTKVVVFSLTLLLIIFIFLFIGIQVFWVLEEVDGSATLDITCYSCGGVTYENKVQVKDYKLLDCGGIRFQEEKTGNWVNLGGECVVKILEK